MVTNGKLDVNTLTKVPLSAGGFGYLEKSTAQGWFAAREDLIRTTGTVPIIIGDGLYRDYARQVYWKTYWTRLGKPENAATAGTSNHGLGLAVDINNISAYNQKTLDAVMSRHGFVRDTSETWHYHHTSTNPADSGSQEIPAENEKPQLQKALDMPITVQIVGQVPAEHSSKAGWSGLIGFDGIRHLGSQHDVDFFAAQTNIDRLSAKVEWNDFLTLIGGFAIPDSVFSNLSPTYKGWLRATGDIS